jgi:nicotinic acetylcholine receptor
LRQQEEERVTSIKNEWKLIALIVDRVLFWVFTVLTFVSSVVLLVVIPVLKNRDVIKAYKFDNDDLSS